MEEKFSDLLEEGEQLLWCGRPEPIETLDKTNRVSIVTGTAIKGIVVAIILVFYGITTGSGGMKPGFFLVLLALGAIVIASPFLVARRLRKGTFYGLTDRRVIRAGSNSGGVPYDRIKTASLKTDPDGHTTLLCGPDMQKMKSCKWRTYADAGFLNSGDAPECDRAVLYALPMEGDLPALLHRFFPID